jgi:8-oxo-dGTP diphosphatase
MQPRNEVAVFGERVDGQSYVMRPSAYALIENDDGRFAVVTAPMGWFLPGGGIEAGETPEQAIAREALEECGLVVEPGLRIAEAIQLVYSAREDTYFEKPSLFLRATVMGTRTSGSDDDHQLLWVTGEAGADRMAHASHAWVLRGAAQPAVAADGKLGRCAPSRSRR